MMKNTSDVPSPPPPLPSAPPSGILPPPAMGDIPPHVLKLIFEFLIGVNDVEVDLRRAHLRSSVAPFMPYILLLYALLIIVGLAANVAVVAHVLWHRLCADPTYAFVINNAISDIVKCAVVLPISLYVMLVQNWTLGELLCSFLPMMQDIPLHVTTLTFVLMAWDRLRWIRDPNKPRLPAFVCIVGAWLTAFCMVLPYPIYIIYVDLGKYSTAFDGIGFCVVNLSDDMQEYMRGMFLIMYVAPMATISYLYVKSSRQLQTSATIIMYETRHRGSNRSRADSHATSIDMRGSRRESDQVSQYSRASSHRYRQPSRSHVGGNFFGGGGYPFGEPELDIGRENRTNKYLASTVTAYAGLMCPLMVLRVVRLALLETNDNSAHFDYTYTIFVWIGFLSTISTPAFYAAWQMSRPAKERLKGYFRFSTRRKAETAAAARASCDTVETTMTSSNNQASPSSQRRHNNRHHSLQSDQKPPQQQSSLPAFGLEPLGRTASTRSQQRHTNLVPATHNYHNQNREVSHHQQPPHHGGGDQERYYQPPYEYEYVDGHAMRDDGVIGRRLPQRPDLIANRID